MASWKLEPMSAMDGTVYVDPCATSTASPPAFRSASPTSGSMRYLAGDLLRALRNEKPPLLAQALLFPNIERSCGSSHDLAPPLTRRWTPSRNLLPLQHSPCLQPSSTTS